MRRLNHPCYSLLSSICSLSTRLDAGLVRSTSLKSAPLSDFDDVAINSFNDEALHHAPKTHRKRTALRSVAKYAFTFVAIATTISTMSAPLAFAAKKAAEEVVEHLHVGQKVANYFRTFGIPDLAVLAMISAMPVVELRGAVPVGVWMGLPIAKVLPVCVLGNMAPIIPLLFLLRNDKLK